MITVNVKTEWTQNGNEYLSPDELVSVYECTDGTWRVQWFPYSDKERNLTREQAFTIAEKKHKEAVEALKRFESVHGGL